MCYFGDLYASHGVFFPAKVMWTNSDQYQVTLVLFISPEPKAQSELLRSLFVRRAWCVVRGAWCVFRRPSCVNFFTFSSSS